MFEIGVDKMVNTQVSIRTAESVTVSTSGWDNQMVKFCGGRVL